MHAARAQIATQRPDWTTLHALPKRPYAPILVTAHLNVVFTLQWVFEGDQRDQVGPAQLSYQRYDNLLIRKRGGKLHHPAKVLFRKTTAVILHQLDRQASQDFFAVFGPYPS